MHATWAEVSGMETTVSGMVSEVSGMVAKVSGMVSGKGHRTAIIMLLCALCQGLQHSDNEDRLHHVRHSDTLIVPFPYHAAESPGARILHQQDHQEDPS